MHNLRVVKFYPACDEMTAARPSHSCPQAFCFVSKRARERVRALSSMARLTETARFGNSESQTNAPKGQPCARAYAEISGVSFPVWAMNSLCIALVQATYSICRSGSVQ